MPRLHQLEQELLGEHVKSEMWIVGATEIIQLFCHPKPSFPLDYLDNSSVPAPLLIRYLRGHRNPTESGHTHPLQKEFLEETVKTWGGLRAVAVGIKFWHDTSLLVHSLRRYFFTGAITLSSCSCAVSRQVYTGCLPFEDWAHLRIGCTGLVHRFARRCLGMISTMPIVRTPATPITTQTQKGRWV